jgi:hypothetical protein
MFEQTEKFDYAAQYQTGIKNFAQLFRLWMDGNHWSHPVMTQLLRGCLDGCGWLHSSQISGFRHGRLHNPGPRPFIAIERLNFYLHRYRTTRTLVPGTTSSNHYSDPLVILEDGVPPPPGWWFEVFTGVRVPTDYDLSGSFYSDAEAAQLTRNLARLLRRQMASSGFDPIDDLGKILQEHFQPAGTRRTRLNEILMGKGQVWTGEEFQRELPHLITLSAALQGPSTEDDLIELLSKP